MAEYHGQIQLALAGFYDVLTAEGTLFRTRARGNFRKKDLKPLVGDWVTFSAQTSKEGYILAIDQRKNSIVRPPVANVDQVIVVTAVKMPDWSSNLLDRQLVALEEKNIEPVIYFTKTDLLTREETASFADIVAGYREIGYQVVWPDEAFDETSLKTVEKLLGDKLTVLMGQTGAGKSTLLNHLSPELNLATGEVSQALSRGKHTTRQVSLIALYGGLVADTPGFSAFEVFDMPARELGQYFRELNDYASNCRFRGCVHLNEPNCAVKEAVSQGEIMASRYENYKLFYDLIAGRRPVYNKHDKKH
ncbi:ribosome small subunit-dependent GTPase A [Weissella hellenica]|uniref:Small ribosomal subunit biogenesis GTPase RsgA n=1 Tax=Weissella hellenica TaxID=46256 RepID=A0A4Y4G1D1_WEIHE|nr:ribosome small subunit-dependent GTPase A [Weissella hellenica]NKY67025.1 ribosome small subunit-dependent GTPase A [Weissella hellenica]GED36039.1 putative ribosome biogenesis GTPase RsgA 1 [Weissella hellenica]SCB96499.1 ribosome biogenesis GTPase [Weissella hellenica]